MGAQECLGIEYSFVVFTSRLSVLVAIADVLGDNVVKRQHGALQQQSRASNTVIK
jgi:hypothetical protein